MKFLKWGKGLFQRITLELTTSEMSRTAHVSGDMRIAEACWHEWRKDVDFNSAIERVKARNAFHAGWIAKGEFLKCRKS